MTNLEIAQAARLRPIRDVALEAGLTEEEFDTYGRYKAKLTAEGVSRLRSRSRGKLVLVSAITPTPAGEGKTTTAIGLAQGLCKIGKRALPATREPALGPIFGIKGGACGGGYSQVLPMEDINLFFNGDFPAIQASHNLLSAMLDAHIHNGNSLGVDVRQPFWPRTVDMNDRALRDILVGLGGKSNGTPRSDGFVITPASEVMAILCLSRDLAELKERLGRIVGGVTRAGAPITAADLQANGAMAALLRDAVRPNLVQTLEGGPAFVHGGPFGNIAHGASSIVATECGLGLADYVVTEGGFASDLGGEKFLNIVCPRLGRGPDAIVLVATVKALQHHGGGDDLAALEAGLANLFRHLQHLRQYGPPVVVAINRFAQDSEEELCRVRDLCAQRGVEAVVAAPATEGGKGCTDLAQAVAAAADRTSTFSPLYASEDSAEVKLTKIVQKAYGGATVHLQDAARKRLEWASKHGFGDFPVCVAKTQYSLSADPTQKNAPEGFAVEVRDVKVSAGAGFLVAIAGEIMLMPGLGKSPAAHRIDVEPDGRITGLF